MPRILLFLLTFPLLILGGCKACTPGLPGPPHVDTNQNNDTADTGDSGDSGDSTPIDTTPPPPCDVPEVEPNDFGHPQDLSLDEWACGAFEANGNSDSGSGIWDPEVFQFSIDQADWVRVDIHAASIGSSADIWMQFSPTSDSSGTDYSARVYSSSENSDPFLVFPADSARKFQSILSESYYGYGDDFTWELMATVTKPPVTWNKEEVEPNDPEPSSSPHYARAQALESGDALFGRMDEAYDIDTFAITIPDDGAEYTVSASVAAFEKGSPADLYMVLYDPTEIAKKSAYIGDNSYDPDPKMEYTASTPGTWILLVREQQDRGSAAYWYVLSLELTRIAPTDTADTATSAAP